MNSSIKQFCISQNTNQNLGSEKEVKDNRQDQNQKKKLALELLKRNTKTLVDSKEVFQLEQPRTSSVGDVSKEEDFFEIPASQSPPKEVKKRHSLGAPSSMAAVNFADSGSAKKVSFLENKSLNRVKNHERKSFNQSMISSPSIMSSSKLIKRPVSLNETSTSNESPTEKKKKAENAFDVDNIFEELKKSDKTTKEDEIKVPPTVKDNQPVAETSKTSSSEDQKTDKSSSEISPVKPFKPNPEWSEINAQALRNLTEKSANFRTVLDEMKKAK